MIRARSGFGTPEEVAEFKQEQAERMTDPKHAAVVEQIRQRQDAESIGDTEPSWTARTASPSLEKLIEHALSQLPELKSTSKERVAEISQEVAKSISRSNSLDR